MKQFVDRLPGIVVVIATTLIALVIGIVVVYVVLFIEKRGRWEQLAAPPGEIVRLVTGDTDHVVVETASGSKYEIQCRTNKEYPCLVGVEAPTDVHQYKCDSEDFPIPSGQVKDHLLTCIEYEYMIRAQYVLREDGSLWRWKVSIFPYGQVATFIGIMIVSIILGFFTGVYVVVSRH